MLNVIRREPDDRPADRLAQCARSAVLEQRRTRAWSECQEPIDRLFAGVTQVALDLAARLPERVIDIGCGSGSTVFELAARVGPMGYVLGADISMKSVTQANDRIAAAGVRHAEAALADVSTHAFVPDSFWRSRVSA
jgi:tRNA G46 methylase TrmB